MSTSRDSQRDRRLEGKVVVVTGAGHGIGREYARDLASRGASVVLADIDVEAARSAAQELGEDVALAVGVDVTDRAACEAMASATLERFGRIDGLVNNAALFATIPISRGGSRDIGEDEWDRVMSVNVKGTWLPSIAVAPAMIEQQGGALVNISSGTALKGAAGRPHYIASKAAVIGLTKSMAREFGEHGVRANVIALGNTLSEEDPDEDTTTRRAGAISTRALQRLQYPSDAVGVVAFLVSDDSGFMTGQTLVVDGGSYMH